MSGIHRASGGGVAEIPAGVVYSAERVFTQAEVNTGYDLVAAEDGVQLMLVGYLFRFIGTWTGTGATTVRLSDTAIGNQMAFEEGTFGSDVGYTEGDQSGGMSNNDMAKICTLLTAGLGLRIAAASGTWSGGGTVRVRLLYRRITA